MDGPSEAEYHKTAIEAIEDAQPDTFVFAFVEDDGPRTLWQDGEATKTVNTPLLLGAMIDSIAAATGTPPEQVALMALDAAKNDLGGVRSHQSTVLE